MGTPAVTILVALVLFQLKHYVCDFVLQTQSQLAAKGIYGAPGGLRHAGLHAIGSIPALCVLTRSPLVILALIAFEFVLHYHVDYTKARVDAAHGWTVADLQYWIVFGLDQFVHQLTYLGFVGVVELL
jgi:Protein of unknown function (DUF3307)